MKKDKKLLVPDEILEKQFSGSGRSVAEGSRAINDNVEEIARGLSKPPVRIEDEIVSSLKEKPIPESLRRIREAKSHQSFNSPKSTADSLSGVRAKILEKGGSATKVVNSPKELEMARDAVGTGITKSRVGQVSKEANDAYKSAKGLTGPKKMFQKGSGRFGILASLLGTGVSALAPNSAAAQLIDKVGAAADENDPGQILQRSINDTTKLDSMLEKIKQKKMMEKQNREDKELSDEAVGNVVNILGGNPGMNPKRASALTGEADSRDIEEGALNYQDFLEKRKRKSGY